MIDHWRQVAERWSQVGPPLRPSPSDIQVYSSMLSAEVPVSALILGVTPELAALDWPMGSRVLAVDHTEAMIRAIWTGAPSSATLGDWRHLPVRDASIDCAFCDGGLHLLDFPNGQMDLIREVGRVLAVGGRFALRLFLPPSLPESPDDVVNDLFNGRLPNLNVLKLRLGHSLCLDPATGVALAEVFRVIDALAPDLDALADRLRWERLDLRAIESYRDSANRYHFVSLMEVQALFGNAFKELVLESLTPGTGVMGEQCPTAIWRKEGTP